LNNRKIVIITARVHAAEAVSSFKMAGILKFLVSNEAVKLRDLYVFKIVPLLNPEGVISGNSRCSIIGVDLNRRWDNPNPILHPQIFHLKNLIKKLVAEKKEIVAFFDLHGHSRRNNSFIYGCNRAVDEGFSSWTKVRLLPRILATKTSLFSYNDCRFHIEPYKQRTARVIAWKELKITNSFTLESSFYGYLRGDKIRMYDIEDYYELGYSVLRSLLTYYYVVKSLEKELIMTKGWLKPYRLFEITGVLAVEELKRQIENERKNKRVKSRIMEAKEITKKIERKRNMKMSSTDNPKRSKSVNRLTVTKNLLNENIDTTYEYDNLISSKSPVNSKVIVRESTMNDNSSSSIVGTTKMLKPIKIEYTQLENIKSNNNVKEPPKNKKLKNDWRSYFPKEELKAAYNNIMAGIDPNDKVTEGSICDSDSNPSEDNIEPDEIQELLCVLHEEKVN